MRPITRDNLIVRARERYKYRTAWEDEEHKLPLVLPVMPGSEEQKKAFLSSSHFAVVGASKDETKFGTKVLKWYLANSKDVTPVHPKESEIQGVAVIRALADLPDPTNTSVSVITGPKITLGLLEQAKALGIPSLWLQPGADDETIVSYINENGLADKVIYGGPCVLREGSDLLASL